MKHLHKTSGMTFDCGELIERDTGKTFDITVITLWDDTDINELQPGEDLRPPVIVGYYFGEYNKEYTDYYIDEWFRKQKMDADWAQLVSDCADIVEAYFITNEDVLKEAEFKQQCDKVVNTLHKLKSVLDTYRKA